jgi:hypothetical protein
MPLNSLAARVALWLRDGILFVDSLKARKSDGARQKQKLGPEGEPKMLGSRTLTRLARRSAVAAVSRCGATAARPFASLGKPESRERRSDNGPELIEMWRVTIFYRQFPRHRDAARVGDCVP